MDAKKILEAFEKEMEYFDDIIDKADEEIARWEGVKDSCKTAKNRFCDFWDLLRQAVEKEEREKGE